MTTLGIVGGSGLYVMEGITELAAHEVNTPYGMPSAPILEATLDHPQNLAGSTSTRLLFLARHGQKHQIAPHEVNYRANICALKMLGAQQVVSVSAVGSMQEHVVPGDVVVVDQYIDWTRGRPSTFFDDGVVAHVSLAEPSCERLRASALAAVLQAQAGSDRSFKVHASGTYLCMQGPQFSSRAESQLYRSWGVHVIGMTAATEAKLAREAQLPYITISLATDYDCWREHESQVSVQAVLAVLRENVALSQTIIRLLPQHLADPKLSQASSSLSHAVISHGPYSDEVRERFKWLLPDLS